MSFLVGRVVAECQRRVHDDTGAYSVELVLWTPALLLLIMLAVAGGRIVSAGNQAVEASRDAARAASLSFTLPQATAAAKSAAHYALGRAGVTCGSLHVAVSGSVRPGGLITVQVRCTAGLTDIAIPGLPGAKTLTGTSSAPIEITRSVAASGSQP